MKRSSLLTFDGILNLALGALLIVFPDSLVSALGVPDATPAFYPNILGGVLFGIGIALLIERKNQHHEGIGLGLGGAIAINFCGGLVLGAWMLFGGLSLPLRGSVFLWALVVLLVAITLAELISVCQNSGKSQNPQSRGHQDNDFTSWPYKLSTPLSKNFLYLPESVPTINDIDNLIQILFDYPEPTLLSF